MSNFKVGFVIPLKPKHKASDWQGVCAALNNTLQSLLNQECSAFKAYVICNDLPLHRIEEPRISYLQTPFPFQEFEDIPEHEQLLSSLKSEKMVVRRWDKARKVTYGSLIAMQDGCTYIMALDADDFVSNRLVAYVYENHHAETVPGWILRQGLVHKEGQMFLMKVPKHFDKFNGSTAILHKRLIEIPDFDSAVYQKYNLFTDHGWLYDRLIAEKGVILAELPFPAVVYVVHGNNVSDIDRLVYGLSIKKLIKRVVFGRSITNRLKEEFLLRPLPVTDTPLLSLRWLSFRRLKAILSFIHQHPMARKHPGFYYRRFFLWQIEQRLNPHDKIVDFTSRTKLVLRRHLIGATGNYYTGLQDFAEMGFLLHMLREDDLFADVGANVGTYTVLASGHVGARTVSFEPVPSTISYFQKNIQANKIENLVHLYEVALGAGQGSIAFTTAWDAENRVAAVHDQEHQIMVTVARYDQTASVHGVPNLVKLDVEGYEMAVLEGMSGIIADPELKAIIIELNGSGYRYDFDQEQIHLQLKALGFYPFTYDPFARKLLQLETFGPHNTIYIRDLSFVEQRIRTAGKVEVNGVSF